MKFTLQYPGERAGVSADFMTPQAIRRVGTRSEKAGFGATRVAGYVDASSPAAPVGYIEAFGAAFIS